MGSRQNNLLPILKRFLDKAGTEKLSPEELQMTWYKLGSKLNINIGATESEGRVERHRREL